MSKSRGILAPRSRWTDSELKQLRALYADQLTNDIAVALGRPVELVYRMAYKLGLKKSAQFLASPAAKRLDGVVGASSRFLPGQKPWNAGMKGWSAPGTKATRFQPGQRPHTWRPVGSYRISRDGHLERKVNDLPGANHVRWHPVSRLVWESIHGPVSKGYIVVFRRGCKTTKLEDITIDRVECISRNENARRNHPRSKSPELGKLVQLRGAITRQINRRNRENTRTESQGATP